MGWGAITPTETGAVHESAAVTGYTNPIIMTTMTIVDGNSAAMKMYCTVAVECIYYSVYLTGVDADTAIEYHCAPLQMLSAAGRFDT